MTKGVAEATPAVDTTAHDGLAAHRGWDHKVLASHGVDPHRVAEFANRATAAHEFLSSLLDYRPDFALLVLGPDDWPQRSSHPLYGMPNYVRGNLIVAAITNPFWIPFLDMVNKGAPDRMTAISAVYGVPGSGVDLTTFFDLLTIHELGHAFFSNGIARPPRRWLDEFACNLGLHNYVATREPEALRALTTFPSAVAACPPPEGGYRTLADFDAHYDDMDPLNYGWYQCRLHVAATTVHDVAGIPATRRLWDAYATSGGARGDDAVSDANLVKSLDTVHPVFRDIVQRW